MGGHGVHITSYYVGTGNKVLPCGITLFPFFSLIGPKHDHIQAREFIAKMYINVNQQRSADIYPHFTCATDTENIRFVFEVVRNHILQQHIVEVIPGL